MSLKSTIAWNCISQMGQSGIQFLSTIILARLLTPDDFAIIGIVTIFITLGYMMVDSEMGGALLRKKQVSVVDYSTLFFYNLGVSIILYALLFIIAPLFADFYGKPFLTDVIRVIGIAIVIHAFRVVQQVMLLRDLSFKTLTIISISSGALSLIAAIYLAYDGWGYWALIYQIIIAAVLNVTFLSLRNRFIPVLKFSRTSFNEQFKFGISLLCSDSLKVLANNISLNIIAKFAPMQLTGNYTQYSRITSFSQNFFGSLMNQSIFPHLAKIDDKGRLLFHYNRMYKAVTLIMMLLTIIVLLFADPIVRIILGTEWLSEIWIFKILSLTTLPVAVQLLIRNVLKAYGETSIILRIESVKSILVIGILLLSILGGLNIIVWSVAFGQTLATIYSLYQADKSIGFISQKHLIVFVLASILLYSIVFVSL